MTLLDRLAAGLEANATEIEARLLAIVRDGADSDALRAISDWINRVHGRPTERLEQVGLEPGLMERLRERSETIASERIAELQFEETKLRAVK